MIVTLIPSPYAVYKHRVILPNQKIIDFGRTNIVDYTEHQDPRQVRRYLLERGAVVPEELRFEKNFKKVHEGMLMVDSSRYENWNNFEDPKYWERWLLWSQPSILEAQIWLTMKDNILFQSIPDNFCYLSNC